ncbi:MAG: flagellar biosynthesis protein FlhB [Rhodobacteraceae bacterium]|nr:flagellar biosynthesis protein FlhB [Paracoccaceae bacterium]
MSEDSNSGGGEKTHDPTAKKIEDARQKGNVVRSNDISAAAAYLGFGLALIFAGPATVENTGAAISAALGMADTLSRQILGAGGAVVFLGLIGRVAKAVAPLFLLPALAVLLSIIAQRALVFAPDKLQPKLSRISPLAQAKNKFGASGLFEFAKSFTKLVVLSIVVAMFLNANLDQIIGSIHSSQFDVANLIADNLSRFLWLVFAVALIISAADYFWQAFDHNRKLMMSRQEVMDETKNAEGDPHLKQARRQRGYDIATQRMMMDVPKADVILVNPQHYAVALKWDRNGGGAPVCVAKGVDQVAARIREIAAEAGVPIHRDPPTARVLHAVVEIGEEVRPEHYKAVAAAIRYAEKVRKLARGRGRNE